MASAARAIEEPAFEVLRALNDQVELRRYAPFVVAEVLVPGPAEEAGNQAFPILAGYIFGKNKGERKLEMTAPVTQAAAPVKLPMTAPVTQAPAADGFIVQFVLPRSVTLATAPQPLDARVMLREVDPASTSRQPAVPHLGQRSGGPPTVHHDEAVPVFVSSEGRQRCPMSSEP